MVLVTGGTGLVGSHLLLQLVKDNTPVRAVYRSTEKMDQVKKTFSYYTEDAELLFNSINWIRGDILDIPSLEKAFVDITHVYHCAALISFDPSDFELLERVNREGTANIVNMSIANNIRKVCYVSSISTIGRAGNKKEANEETDWNGQHASPYAITKHLAEMEVWRGAQEGLKVVMVNPGVILGPGYWKKGSGTFFRTAAKGYNYYPPGGSGFVAITDVVKIMVQLMHSSIHGERFITVAENLSYREILKRITRSMNKKPPKKQLKIWQLKVGKSVDWLRNVFTGKRRTITTSTIYGLQHPNKFNNEKVKQALPFEFESIDHVIALTTKLFIEEHSA